MSLKNHTDTQIYNEYTVVGKIEQDRAAKVDRLVEKINLGQDYKNDLRKYLEDVSEKMVLL